MMSFRRVNFFEIENESIKLMKGHLKRNKKRLKNLKYL